MSTQNYTVLNSCRVCNQTSVLKFLNLTDTPLADNFKDSPDLPEEKYPLGLMVCPTCKTVQNICDVKDNVLYNQDYAFFTGGSPSLTQYFKDYAQWVKDNYPQKTDGLIFEIASNDGTLLENFKGKNIMGVDPATTCAKVAQDKGIPTMTYHFNSSTAKKIVGKVGNASIVMANNVIAHISDINDFMRGVYDLLEEDGVFIAEFQYFPKLLFNNEFDNVYHEHKFFWSMMAMVGLLDKHDMKIIKVIETPQQGGSIRIVASKSSWRYQCDEVDEMLNYERSIGLDKPQTYLSMQSRVDYVVATLRKTLIKLKKEGKTIHGFGASAKSCTLLNHCRIDKDLIDCIEDTTPFKYGKYAPGSNLPVVEQGSVERPDYYLLLVWNYLPKLIKSTDFNFVVPIPAPYTI